MTDQTTGPDPDLALPGRPRRPAAGVWSWVAAAVILAVTAALVVVAVHRWNDREADPATEAPVDVARSVARDFFSLDYRTLDDDLARVRAQATGQLAKQLGKQATQLRESVTDKKLVLSADVPAEGTAVEYLGPDDAWVLVALDVHTTSQGEQATDQRYRTRVVLERVDGTWRAARLEQVG